MSVHEPSVSRRKLATGSDRSFGIVFAAVFAIVSLWPLLSGGAPRLWAGLVAVAFAALAAFAPRLLSPLNRLWFRFGLVLHHVVNPLVMGLIFVCAFVPVGLLLKAFGKDVLRLRREPRAASYWIIREPPGPPSGSMSKQF